MRTLLTVILSIMALGCGNDTPPPPKVDAASIKASQDEQANIAAGEGATKK